MLSQVNEHEGERSTDSKPASPNPKNLRHGGTGELESKMSSYSTFKSIKEKIFGRIEL